MYQNGLHSWGFLGDRAEPCLREKSLICCLLTGIHDPDDLVSLTEYNLAELVNTLEVNRTVRRFASIDRWCLINQVSGAIKHPRRCFRCGQLCSQWPCIRCQMRGINDDKRLMRPGHYDALVAEANQRLEDKRNEFSASSEPDRCTPR